MLIDIIRMPQVLGIPINRRLQIYSGGDYNIYDNAGVNWSQLPFNKSRIWVGSHINTTPSHVYKAIYLSRDFRYAFEVVFSIESDHVICLYVKTINNFGSTFGVPVKSIEFYHDNSSNIQPLTHFLYPVSDTGPWTSVPLIKMSLVENIIPVILGHSSLMSFISEISNNTRITPDINAISWQFAPIHRYLPQVFEALLNGVFYRNPFWELKEFYGSIVIPRHDWYRHEMIEQDYHRHLMEVIVNSPEFDGIVMDLMSMFVADFSASCSFLHAIEGLTDCWLIHHYSDIYGPVLKQYHKPRERASIALEGLSNIFNACIMIYCKIYQIDYFLFISSKEESVITITKTIHDEIEILFDDKVTNRKICFYSSFPALALSTMAVGWYN